MNSIETMLEARKLERAGDHEGARKLVLAARQMLNADANSAVDALEAAQQPPPPLSVATFDFDNPAPGLNWSDPASVQSYVAAATGLPAPAPVPAPVAEPAEGSILSA